jgi:hypothetical protein
MSTITATKEILWDGSFTTDGSVNVRRITRVIDDEGNVHDAYWRRSITPDVADGFEDLPPAMQPPAHVRAVIAAARYPEAVARFEARKAKQEKP